jgi:single-strand DNA-binding protein
MSSYNKVILLANLTREPQVRFTPSQHPVVEFGIATNRKWRGTDGQERNETCYVDCVMFGKRAEVIGKFFHKGMPIFIEGRLTFESWQGQDGKKRSKLKVTVDNFEFVGKGESAPDGDRQSSPQTEAGPSDAMPDDSEIPF